jgi:hypothetical protein
VTDSGSLRGLAVRPPRALGTLESADTLWQGTAYPQAGEGTITVRRRTGSESPSRRRPSPDDARRRARRRVRRYCVAHRLTRFVTLTYREPQADRQVVRRHVRQFLRALPPGPWAYAIHPHPGGHGLHVHLLIPTNPKTSIEAAWRHGFVDSQRSRSRAQIRSRAEYLVGEDSGRKGAHRYDVAKGFPIQISRFAADTEATVFDQVVECMGGKLPTWELRLEDRSRHRGSPFRVLFWDDDDGTQYPASNWTC